jgi:hypothetical protein
MLSSAAMMMQRSAHNSDFILSLLTPCQRIAIYGEDKKLARGSLTVLVRYPDVLPIVP